MRVFAVFFSTAMSFFTTFSFSQTTNLLPGDIAVIGFNFEDPDQFSFINLVPLSQDTEIHFTDSGWTQEGSLRENEGIITYKVPTGGLETGTIITYPDDAGFTKKGVNGFFGFSKSGDQLLVYQGTFEDPDFIFAINSNSTNDWDADASNNNTSALPLGLTNGVNAIALNNYNNAYYSCSINGGKTKLLNALIEPSNWIATSSRVDLPAPCDYILPLHIQKFKISELNRNAFLDIQIFPSSDIKKLAIEKQFGDFQFSNFKDLSINTASHQITDYEFEKDSYYRLRIQYENDQEEFTNPVFLQKSFAEGLLVYSENDRIHIMNDIELKEFTIFNSAGIQVSKFEKASNIEVLEEYLNTLESGVYIMHCIMNERTESIRFVIK